MNIQTEQIFVAALIYIHRSGKFRCKKLCKAQTSTKLKHMRFFTMTILLSNNWYMHLPFIAHTHARQMYVTITCTRLKRAFPFISCRIVLISVQDDGDGCESGIYSFHHLS